MSRRVGDFMAAWGGIASLELSLPAVVDLVSSAALQAPTWRRSERRARCADLARWMSAAPASLAGLGTRKGRIAPGFDADLVVWDPDAECVVDPARLQQRHKLTPYAGRSLAGSGGDDVRSRRAGVGREPARRAPYGGRLL